MRAETTWYAIDDTEFDSKEECEAYETALEEGFKSIVFFDENLNLIRFFEPEHISDYAFYMGIREPEKAWDFIRWLYGYAGMSIDGIPEELKVGQVYAWDNSDEVWKDPAAQLAALQEIVDKIIKAVAAVW